MTRLLLLFCACNLGSGYRCARDSQCRFGDSVGNCEETGYCSFSDASCTGGRRYGRWAPAPLGSACVPAGVDMAGPPDGACGGDLQPCCAGACDGGLTCGNGTCFFFYDGFDGTISTVWSKREENGGSVAVDTKAFRGSGSLKVTAKPGTLSWEQVDLERPASQTPLYARAFVWMPSTATLSASEETQLFIYRDSNDTPYPLAALALSSSFRLVAEVQNWTSTPIKNVAPTSMPLDNWVCLEWQVRWDASPSVSVSAQSMPAASIAPAVLPNPLNIWAIGFEGPPPGSEVSFWIDELALDQNPIGCSR